MKKHSTEVVAAALQAYLKKTGMSQRALAKKVGRSEQVMGRYVAGRVKRISDNTFETLEPILNVAGYTRTNTTKTGERYLTQHRRWQCGDTIEDAYQWRLIPCGLPHYCDEAEYLERRGR